MQTYVCWVYNGGMDYMANESFTLRKMKVY